MSSAKYICFFYFIQRFIEFIAIQNFDSKKNRYIEIGIEILFFFFESFLVLSSDLFVFMFRIHSKTFFGFIANSTF